MRANVVLLSLLSIRSRLPLCWFIICLERLSPMPEPLGLVV